VSAQSRTVLITGGARRLGQAIALELARDGANVVITYNTSQVEAEQTLDALRAIAPDARHLAFAADLTQADAITKLTEDVLDAYGRVDALVNNAAIFRRTPFADISERDFDEHIAANLKAPFLLCKRLGDHFLQHGGGSILNIADVHAYRPLGNYASYCVSKAGLVMLSQSLAIALAPLVRVNCLCPGTILPPDSADDKATAKLVQHIPMQRMGTPQEVAEAAKFLLFGPEFLTGVVLPIDGGRQLR
jgi:pteridine reductase